MQSIPSQHRRRLHAAVTVLVLLLSPLALASAPLPRAVAATSTVVAAADAHVRADNPTTNYGTATGLRVDGSPISNAYLRFDITGLNAAPGKATLRVYAKTSSSKGADLHTVANTGWTENGITYNNAPSVGATIGSSGALTSGTWVSYDVTNKVTGNGTYAFAITTTSSTSRTFDSIQGTNKPQLVLEDATTSPPPPPTGGPIVATADAHVRADNPTTNYGTATGLRVDGSPISNAYLRFDITGLNAAPGKATLRVYAKTSSSKGADLHTVANTGWTENGITYNNAPSIGATIGSSGALTSGTWVSYDVTNKVTGNGTYAFAITTTSSTSRTFDSIQGTNKPQLVLEDATTPPPPPPGGSVVVAAAGDVACAPDDPGFNNGDGTADRCHMKATSDLVLGLNPASVFALGDLQYNGGSLANFNASYDLSWGRFKNLTRPVVGNHEYGTSGAAGYFTYFGDAATPREPGCRADCDGYYSFDIGGWHAVVLNSECARIDGGNGCANGSPQHTWLAADLAANPASCTVALVHKPRWSSNSLVAPEIGPLVQTLYDANVDLMLAGHSHSYERFAPQNPSGALDNSRGIRQIVVGTGGAFFTGFSTVQPNSEVRKANVFGVLKLTLRSNGYDWAFVADPATPFTDTGTGSCH